MYYSLQDYHYHYFIFFNFIITVNPSFDFRILCFVNYLPIYNDAKNVYLVTLQFYFVGQYKYQILYTIFIVQIGCIPTVVLLY